MFVSSIVVVPQSVKQTLLLHHPLCISSSGERPESLSAAVVRARATSFGRKDDRVGKAHRTQTSQFELFELFELIPLLKLDKQLSIEQFEATVSQSTVPSPPLLVIRAEPSRFVVGLQRIMRHPSGRSWFNLRCSSLPVTLRAAQVRAQDDRA